MSGDLIREVMRFGTVGAGATLVHLIVAWIANRAGGAPPFAANACGFVAAFTLSYLGHFYWTFGRQAGHARHLPRFVIVASFGYALTNLIIWIVTATAGYPFEASLGVILVAVPSATWLLSRIWAFRTGP
jgi:putative flippase GtrA